MRTCEPGLSAVGTTPGFRWSRESTVVPNRAAIAPRVSPLWITYHRLGREGFARIAVEEVPVRLTAGCTVAGEPSDRMVLRRASATRVTTSRKAAGTT